MIHFYYFFTELSFQLKNGNTEVQPEPQPHVNIPLGQQAIVYGYHFGSERNGVINQLKDDDDQLFMIRVSDGLVRYITPEYFNNLRNTYHLKQFARAKNLSKIRVPVPPGGVHQPSPPHM